eukprot:11214702-Karenia_brevis.AAC.1
MALVPRCTKSCSPGFASSMRVVLIHPGAMQNRSRMDSGGQPASQPVRQASRSDAQAASQQVKRLGSRPGGHTAKHPAGSQSAARQSIIYKIHIDNI